METLPQLKMKHPDLSKLPPLMLPDGVTVHTERPDSPSNWTRIIEDSFQSSSFVYEQTIREKLGYHPYGVFFVTWNGEDAATATSVRNADHPDYGWIHMVGALSSARGHKLGYYAVLAALHDIRTRGMSQAGLTTDDFRLPAIKTYLSLGFEPWMTHESHPTRWEKIFSILQTK